VKQRRRRKSPQVLPKAKWHGKLCLLSLLFCTTLRYRVPSIHDEVVATAEDEEVEMVAAEVHHLDPLLQRMDRMGIQSMETRVGVIDPKELREAHLRQRASELSVRNCQQGGTVETSRRGKMALPKTVLRL
jgi:hypothetical protein